VIHVVSFPVDSTYQLALSDYIQTQLSSISHSTMHVIRVDPDVASVITKIQLARAKCENGDNRLLTPKEVKLRLKGTIHSKLFLIRT
jgi:hypothetical protein